MRDLPANLAVFDPADWVDESDYHCELGARWAADQLWSSARFTWAKDYATEHDVTEDEARDLLPEHELTELDHRFCYGCI